MQRNVCTHQQITSQTLSRLRTGVSMASGKTRAEHLFSASHVTLRLMISCALLSSSLPCINTRFHPLFQARTAFIPVGTDPGLFQVLSKYKPQPKKSAGFAHALVILSSSCSFDVFRIPCVWRPWPDLLVKVPSRIKPLANDSFPWKREIRDYCAKISLARGNKLD